MAKSNYILFSLWLILFLSPKNLDSSCITDVADSQIGVREIGENGGWRVGQYQKSTGNKQGDSWCSSFVHWCYLQCGKTIPTNGGAYSNLNYKHLVYFNNKFKESPIPGDIFTIYSISQKRIHHTGFYRDKYNDKMYYTVEGNTNTNGSSNGIGVFKRIRSYNTTYSISRFD